MSLDIQNIKEGQIVKVKDFPVGTILDCVLFIKAKQQRQCMMKNMQAKQSGKGGGNRHRFFQGIVSEKSGRKHLIGFSIPTRGCLLSFGEGTKIEKIFEMRQNDSSQSRNPHNIFRFPKT